MARKRNKRKPNKKQSVQQLDEEMETLSKHCPTLDKSMIFIENRLKTFENWPYSDNVVCCAKNMAEAGFYCIGGDSAKCYYCLKELDGWEEKDDPMLEHGKHASYCNYVALKQDNVDSRMTVGQMFELEINRVIFELEKEFDKITKCYIDGDSNKLRRYKL